MFLTPCLLASSLDPLSPHQVLLDKGVAEDHILFICVIASPEAVHRASRAGGQGAGTAAAQPQSEALATLTMHRPARSPNQW